MIRNGRPTFLSLGVATLLSFVVATSTVYLFMAAGRGQLPAPILGQIFSPAGIGEMVEPPVIEPPRQAEEIAEGTPVAGPFLVVGGSIGNEPANMNVPASVDVPSPVPATAPFASPPDTFAPVPAGVPLAPDAAADRDTGNDAATPPVVSSNDDSAAGDTGSDGDKGKTKKNNKGKDHQNNGGKDFSKSKSPGGNGNGQAKGHDKHGKH